MSGLEAARPRDATGGLAGRGWRGGRSGLGWLARREFDAATLADVYVKALAAA